MNEVKGCPEMVKWEKEITPNSFEVKIDPKPLKKLHRMSDLSITAAYEPFESTHSIANVLSKSLTTIEFYPPPLFLMSPRTKIYAAKDIRRMKGYLSSFEPVEVEGEEPQMSIGITITERL